MIIFRLSVLFVSLLIFHVVSGYAQSSGTATPVTGQSTLNLSLAASGTTANAVQSLTATGTITYYWSAQPVQGTATIKANSSGQFRLDAALPSGTRSFVASSNGGSLKDINSSVTAVPVHNTLNYGIPIFPYLQIAAALGDSSSTATYVGAVQSGSQQLHQVHVSKTYSKASDPQGIMAGLSGVDYFVDAQTNLVTKTQDLIHPLATITKSYPHEIDLESYTTTNGVAVPTIVREKINGQLIWEFHLSEITFNTNLTATDFTLQ